MQPATPIREAALSSLSRGRGGSATGVARAFAPGDVLILSPMTMHGNSFFFNELSRSGAMNLPCVAQEGESALSIRVPLCTLATRRWFRKGAGSIEVTKTCSCCSNLE